MGALRIARTVVNFKIMLSGVRNLKQEEKTPLEEDRKRKKHNQEAPGLQTIGSWENIPRNSQLLQLTSADDKMLMDRCLHLEQPSWGWQSTSCSSLPGFPPTPSWEKQPPSLQGYIGYWHMFLTPQIL